MNNLIDLIETSRGYDSRKDDLWLRPDQIDFTEAGRLAVQTKYGPMLVTPTENAWRQMFTRLGPAVYGRGSAKGLPADYMLGIPKPMMVANLNGHLQKLMQFNRNQFLTRIYDDTVRAFLGPNYKPEITNTAILERVQRAIDSANFRADSIVRPFVGSDSMTMNIVSFTPANIGSGQYGLGVAVSNDEIGAGGIHVYSLIQRHSCSNSIVLDVDGGVNARHTMDSGLLFSRIFGVLQNALRQTGEWLQKFLDLEDQRLPAFTDLIADMATRYGWTESQATTVAMGTEGKATTMGIINGITWMAHEDTQNATERLEVEKTAGNILMDPDNIMAWARKLAAVRERDELNEKQIDTKRAVERAFNR